MRATTALACTILSIVLTEVRPLDAATPAHFWSQRFGGANTDLANGVVVDQAGNVIIAGQFQGTVNFGGASLVSAGSNDIFLAKYSPNGVHLWSQRFGAGGNDMANGVTVDPFGSIYIGGGFSATVDFGGGAILSAGASDAFIARYDVNGGHLWSDGYGSTGSDNCLGIYGDGASNVVATGFFNGTVDFGGGPLVSAGGNDIFLAKYGPTGIHTWSQRFGSTLSDIGQSVSAVGTSVLVSGSFQGTVDFGGGGRTSAGGSDIFVAKYNTSGAHQWSLAFGNTAIDLGQVVAVNASGTVFLGGHFELTVDFGGGVLDGGVNGDAFLVKFNSSGVHQWSKRFGGVAADVCEAVEIDAAGNVIAGGSFTGTADFGGGPINASPNTADLFLAKYNTSGVHQWSRGFGGTSNDLAYGVDTDAAGNVAAAGYFQLSADFGGGVLLGAGNFDIFLAKFGANAGAPAIASIADIHNDQGRQVRVSFTRGGQDFYESLTPVVQYDVFRRIDPAAAVANGPRARDVAVAGWDFVGSTPAYQESEYSVVVSTLIDSTVTEGMAFSAFFVRAATERPGYFHDSPIDSGYSVDNLAPSAPGGFIFAAGALSWNESKAADFDYFSVYGSASPTFDATATLIDHTIETTFNVSADPHVFYYVTATDFSGNEGSASRVNTASGVETPVAYTLNVNAYPNPFNPSTTVRYDVPSRGRVVVSVFDARGALVTTLVDEDKESGSYPVRWDGLDDTGTRVSSGVYFVTVAFGGARKTTKAVLLK
jgi:hypothetical protein